MTYSEIGKDFEMIHEEKAIPKEDKRSTID
jgi:hypothetical protein